MNCVCMWCADVMCGIFPFERKIIIHRKIILLENVCIQDGFDLLFTKTDFSIRTLLIC